MYKRQPEVNALEVDGALAHLELRRAGLVVHEARLVKMCIRDRVWEKTTYVSLEEERVLLEEDAWKEAALLQLRRLQREELPAGSKVLEEDLTYQFQDGVCVLTAQCRCEEEIGEVRKISVE